MKQHAFISRLKSLAVVFGMALTFASCANEDVALKPTNSNEDNDKGKSKPWKKASSSLRR